MKRAKLVKNTEGRAPIRRAPSKSLLDTASIFELIMPWKSDLPKMV